MDVVALILMVIAIIVFVAVGRTSHRWASVSVGLALVAASLICQFIRLTGHALHVPH